MISQTPWGAAPDGAPVTVYELACGAYRARVMDFGATLVGLDAPNRAGEVADVVLGFGELAGYFDNPACYGAIIGPSANRTDKAEVVLGDAVYHLAGNDGPDNRNNLHTDLARGLHKHVWHATVDEDANRVSFRCPLAAGELGLPGNRTFRVTYTLAPTAGGAALTLTFGCTTDAPTFVNLTSHTYFNLAGHAAGSVLGEEVRIHADRFLPVRADSVSAGAILPVFGTPFDFRDAHALGAAIDDNDEQLAYGHGYDHCFAIDGFTPHAAPRPALEATDPASGRTLQVSLTTPGAHLYTGNWLDDCPAKDGAAYGPRAGFAFEPEYYPDACHHLAWPHPVCTPDEPYEETIVYTLGVAGA